MFLSRPAASLLHVGLSHSIGLRSARRGVNSQGNTRAQDKQCNTFLLHINYFVKSLAQANRFEPDVYTLFCILVKSCPSGPVLHVVLYIVSLNYSSYIVVGYGIPMQFSTLSSWFTHVYSCD